MTEQLDPHDHLSRCLRLCGIRTDKRELELTLALYLLVKEKGTKVDLESICRVEEEINQLLKKI